MEGARANCRRLRRAARRHRRGIWDRATMNLLLDTHAFLWWLDDPHLLSRETHEYRAGGSWLLDPKCRGDVVGQRVEVVGNSHAPLPLPSLAWSVIGSDGHQLDDGFASLGDDHLLACKGKLDELGQLRLGFVDIGDFHGVLQT